MTLQHPAAAATAARGRSSREYSAIGQHSHTCSTKMPTNLCKCAAHNAKVTITTNAQRRLWWCCFSPFICAPAARKHLARSLVTGKTNRRNHGYLGSNLPRLSVPRLKYSVTGFLWSIVGGVPEKKKSTFCARSPEITLRGGVNDTGVEFCRVHRFGEWTWQLSEIMNLFCPFLIIIWWAGVVVSSSLFSSIGFFFRFIFCELPEFAKNLLRVSVWLDKCPWVWDVRDGKRILQKSHTLAFTAKRTEFEIWIRQTRIRASRSECRACNSQHSVVKDCHKLETNLQIIVLSIALKKRSCFFPQKAIFYRPQLVRRSDFLRILDYSPLAYHLQGQYLQTIFRTNCLACS